MIKKSGVSFEMSYISEVIAKKIFAPIFFSSLYRTFNVFLHEKYVLYYKELCVFCDSSCTFYVIEHQKKFSPNKVNSKRRHHTDDLLNMDLLVQDDLNSIDWNVPRNRARGE